MMEDKFVSSMPSQSFDKALEGGLKFYNGEFVSEEQKQALTGPQGEQGPRGETGPQGVTGPQGPIGADGQRGTSILQVSTPLTSTEVTAGTAIIMGYKIALATVMFQCGVSEVLVGDIIQYGSFLYRVGSVDDSYAYITDTPTYIKGDPGPAGAAATINGVNALNIAAGNGINATQSGSTLTLSVAGTFAGQVVANGSGQTPGTSLLRNSRLVSADTNPTVNGEINWTYK